MSGLLMLETMTNNTHIPYMTMTSSLISVCVRTTSNVLFCKCFYCFVLCWCHPEDKDTKMNKMEMARTMITWEWYSTWKINNQRKINDSTKNPSKVIQLFLYFYVSGLFLFFCSMSMANHSQPETNIKFNQSRLHKTTYKVKSISIWTVTQFLTFHLI